MPNRDDSIYRREAVVLHGHKKIQEDKHEECAAGAGRNMLFKYIARSLKWDEIWIIIEEYFFFPNYVSTK